MLNHLQKPPSNPNAAAGCWIARYRRYRRYKRSCKHMFAAGENWRWKEHILTNCRTMLQWRGARCRFRNASCVNGVSWDNWQLSQKKRWLRDEQLTVETISTNQYLHISNGRLRQRGGHNATAARRCGRTASLGCSGTRAVMWSVATAVADAATSLLHASAAASNDDARSG